MAIEAKLSPVFRSLIIELNALPPINFIAATSEVGTTVDLAAERMQHDFEMRGRFDREVRAQRGFSNEVADWAFEKFTGIKIVRHNSGKSTGSLAQEQLGATTNLPRDSSGYNTQPELKFEFSGTYPEFEDWPEPEGASPLQEMIALAKTDPEANLFGGGLPPEDLTYLFHQNVFLPALAATKNWTKTEIDAFMQNYPDAGAGPEHRNLVINGFLGEKERQIIRDNFTEKKQSDGLFFTYGSQQALSYMVRMLVSKEKATPENPVELAVTDPTYPGLLMAADEFLRLGVLKFKIIPISENTGEIDTNALETALNSIRCKAFYLAEGNPIPRQITNLKEVAKIFKRPEYLKKLVFEDRAYLGLGATAENSLFHLLMNRVVAFETFSKKGAPCRIGLVYSNMEPGKFAYIKEAMLKNQYNEMLGYSGNLSGLIVAILRYDTETGAFTRHIQEVQKYYEEKRALYEKSYGEALDLALGEGEYKLEDEVIIGKEKFMFGWRNTHHVLADLYTKAGTEIKLYSLSGSTCRPKPKDIAGDQFLDSPTLYRLRQNYTWIKPENLQIGIFKDVLLQVVFSNMSGEEKQTVANRLCERLKELNKRRPMPEVEEFIKKVSANGWQYNED